MSVRKTFFGVFDWLSESVQLADLLHIRFGTSMNETSFAAQEDQPTAGYILALTRNQLFHPISKRESFNGIGPPGP